MTIEEFRRHPFLPQEWANLVRTSGILQRVLQVMEENSPSHFTLNPDNNGDISQVRANIELGLSRGYYKFGDTLKLMAVPLRPVKDVGEPTYTKPEESKS